MTNKELQEELKKYPDELPVTYLNPEYGDHTDIDTVFLENHEGFNLDNHYIGPHLVLE